MSDIDWVERWKSLVENRAGLAGGHSRSDYWDQRARSYARSTQVRADEFLAVLEPYLAPSKTLIDVGAGTGRHAAPLAARLEWVTAVEPSQGMRDRIPNADNMTVIGSAWMDADPAPADLVVCVHVLYEVAEPIPFIEKLERRARERV